MSFAYKSLPSSSPRSRDEKSPISSSRFTFTIRDDYDYAQDLACIRTHEDFYLSLNDDDDFDTVYRKKRTLKLLPAPPRHMLDKAPPKLSEQHGPNVFTKILSNRRLTEANKITVIDSLIQSFGSAYHPIDLFDEPVLSGLIKHPKMLHDKYRYYHDNIHRQYIPLECEHKIWHTLIQSRLESPESLIKRLKQNNRKRTFAFAIDWINTLNDPTAIIQFYRFVKREATNADQTVFYLDKDVCDELHKIAKQRILQITKNQHHKQLDDNICDFLGEHRSWFGKMFGCFFNTTSQNAYLNLHDAKKAANAATEIDTIQRDVATYVDNRYEEGLKQLFRP